MDGTDGLWMAQENDYDAIVLDLMLPGMNGFQVCRRLRKAEVWTPILVLTAKDGDLDEAEALDTGADGYLTAVLPRRAGGPHPGAGAARETGPALDARGGDLWARSVEPTVLARRRRGLADRPGVRRAGAPGPPPG